jgi:hypothetical protein
MPKAVGLSDQRIEIFETIGQSKHFLPLSYFLRYFFIAIKTGLKYSSILLNDAFPSQMWLQLPTIPVLRRLRQEDGKLEVNLGYLMRLS